MKTLKAFMKEGSNVDRSDYKKQQRKGANLMVKLKKQGLSDKEIADYLRKNVHTEATLPLVRVRITNDVDKIKKLANKFKGNFVQRVGDTTLEFSFKTVELAKKFKDDVNNSGRGNPVDSNWSDRDQSIVGF